jgi:hypothetical protein
MVEMLRRPPLGGGLVGHIAIQGMPADGKVWIRNSEGNNICRLDLVSNKTENLGSFKDPRNGKRIGTYGLHSDFENNIYLLDFAAGNILGGALPYSSGSVVNRSG